MRHVFEVFGQSDANPQPLTFNLHYTEEGAQRERAEVISWMGGESTAPAADDPTVLEVYRNGKRCGVTWYVQREVHL